MKSVTPPATSTQRRAFVTRLFAGAAAIPLFASFASAKPGDGQGRQGQGRPPGGRPDPAQMATRLIAEFDGDGDGALNAAELATALVALHERRPRGRGRGQGQRGQGPGPRQGRPPQQVE